MIDNGKYVLYTSELWNKSNGIPFQYCDVIYNPEYRNGEIFRYKGQLKNLLVLAYPDRIYLTNSFHKYWHGNNYSDYYLSELLETIDEVCSLTGFNWWDAEIKAIEYGCNLKNINVQSLIRCFKSYKRKSFFPMTQTGEKYGVKADLQEFSIKGYDKTFETKHHYGIALPDSIFRWECKAKKSIYFRNRKIPINTLKDLIDKNTFNALALDLIDKFQLSIKIPFVDLSTLDVSIKKILGYMSDNDIREDLQKNHKETYKKDRMKLKKACKTHSDIFNQIEAAIDTKCQQLANS